MKIRFVAVVITLTIVAAFSGCGVIRKLAKTSSTGEYAALLSKKEELANFQPTGNPGEGTPNIKGKVAIVKKESGGQAELDRFDWEGKFSDGSAGKASNFYPPEVYAKKPEEIDTLIKIECREVKGSGSYKAENSSTSQLQEFLKTICDVSVIDYKAKTLLAKVQKGNESAPGTITLGEGGNSYYEVFEEIKAYLKSLPLELLPRVKPTPSGETVAVAEIAKSYKKSKESISRYQDKELTVTGWGFFLKSSDTILIYGNDKNQGIDYISCKIEPDDMADFAELEGDKTYKFTVVGKFDAKYTLRLEKCRLINSEKTVSK